MVVVRDPMRPLPVTVCAILAACSAAPPQAAIVPTIAPVSPSASPGNAPLRGAEPPLVGPSVRVPQRLAQRPSLVALDPTGNFLLLGEPDGWHVVDVLRGETRGIAPRFGDAATFSADGRYVIDSGGRDLVARIWDLETDTTREVRLPSRPAGAFFELPNGRSAIRANGEILALDPVAATVTSLPVNDRTTPDEVEWWPSGVFAGITYRSLTVWGKDGAPVTLALKDHPSRFSVLPSGTLAAIAHKADVALYAVPTGAEVRRFAPCAANLVHALHWTEDGAHLLISCKASKAQPARVILASPSGVEERVLTEGSKRDLILTVHGSQVLLRSAEIGALVLELPTGREVHHFPPPGDGYLAVSASKNLERVLFRKGDHLEETVVIDAGLGPIGPHLQPSAMVPSLSQVGRWARLEFPAARRVQYLDTVSGDVLRDPPGDLGPDNETWVTSKGSGDATVLEFIHRRTGARAEARPLPNLVSVPGSGFSAAGGLYAAVEVASIGDGRGRYVIHIVDTKTGKVARPIDAGEVWFSAVISPDDRFVAALVNTGRERSGQPCTATMDPSCVAIHIYDARAGRPVSVIRPRDRDVDTARFLPTGTHVLVSGRVYDARSGHVAWELPASSFLETTLLATRQILVWDSAVGRYSLADPVMGKTLRPIDGLASILATSPTDAFLLGRKEGAIWLWDTASWTARPTPLEVNLSPVVLRDDGKFAFYVDGLDLAIHRFADGRTLRRALPNLDEDITDEGVYDPDGKVTALWREGPSVLRSPLVPIVAAPKLAHRGLFADFLAGKPVGPIR